MIGQLAGPAKAEPGEAPVERPDGQVGPFNVARAYSVPARVPGLGFDRHADRRGRRIAAGCFNLCRWGIVVLLHDRVIQPVQEVMADSVRIRSPAVRCDLNSANDPACQVRDKGVCVLVIALCGMVGNDQLCASVQGQERVKITPFLIVGRCPALPDSDLFSRYSA